MDFADFIDLYIQASEEIKNRIEQILEEVQLQLEPPD